MKQILRKLLVPRSKLIVLNFHQVSRTFDPKYNHPFIWSDFDFFRKQMDYLLNEQSLISLTEGIELLKTNKLSGTKISITFDDGDRSMAETVIPFLKSKEIPATFFLNTAYPLEQRGYWFNVYHYILSVKRELITPEITRSYESVRTTTDPDIYWKSIETLNKLNSEIKEENPFYCPMSYWKDLDPTLFEVGLHGHEHWRFSMMNDAQREENISTNLTSLKDFPAFRPYFALPHGKSLDHDVQTFRMAKKMGLVTFLANGGYNTTYNEGVLFRESVDNKDLKQLFNGFSPFVKRYYINNGLKYQP